MKKITTLLLTLNVAVCFNVNAQYCTVSSAIPYSPDMPGITNVTFNTINRNSADLEVSMSGTSHINTGLSTNVTQGATYSISITHTIDGTICPDMNLRVWIDFNHDFQLDDPGETVLTTDHHLPGTYTSDITIPMTALVGSTQMRITAKMSNLGGHSLPTPCDNPADPIGYHGEIEDYTLNIGAATGINAVKNNFAFNVLYESLSNPYLVYQLNENTKVTIEVFDILGSRVQTILNKQDQPAGAYKYSLGISEEIQKNGVYFVKINVNNKDFVKKMVIQN